MYTVSIHLRFLVRSDDNLGLPSVNEFPYGSMLSKDIEGAREAASKIAVEALERQGLRLMSGSRRFGELVSTEYSCVV